MVTKLCAAFLRWCFIASFLSSASVSEAADAAPSLPRTHAAAAPLDRFPSHVFQTGPRWHAQPELSVHFGLLQPILFEGFNAALDLRWGPFVASYSHGQGLNYSASPSIGLNAEEAARGLQLLSPWTTGGGVGVVLIDELYLMVDVKRHRYRASLEGDSVSYTTTSVGAELGFRFFAWRGFFVQPVLRYWPNVHDTLRADRANLAGLGHRAKDLGVFTNITVGWAFDI
jgi:hypothetical protein